MNDDIFKQALLDALWQTVDACPMIVSATLTGSFSSASDIRIVSDIDLVLILQNPDPVTVQSLGQAFRAALTPILASRGFELYINQSLGPLKFHNAHTAVLHLMCYTAEAHRDHVIASPFTCLDWQRSALWRRRPMASVYPVYGLQPHHFLNARRSPAEYLSDLDANVISYREVRFDDGYRQIRKSQPMTRRDRIEFAYHVMRFLMQNFLKLVGRTHAVPDDSKLLDHYFQVFPAGADLFAPLFRGLKAAKHDGAAEPEELKLRLHAFVDAFSEQFRQAFEHDASRHVLFRHAPTSLNQRAEPHFQGRIDEPLAANLNVGAPELLAALRRMAPRRTYASPLSRAQDSLVRLGTSNLALPVATTDARLLEIDYGACEGLSVSVARARFPALFEAWQRGDDPAFPNGGESQQQVLDRALAFAAEAWTADGEASATCTHNVVLRCLVGHLLGVPRKEWYRLRIPHLMPIELVATRRFGLFVDLEEAVERRVFEAFFDPGSCAGRKGSGFGVQGSGGNTK